jgi:LysM repeat protein
VQTVAITSVRIKHVFEESWILSAAWGTTSYRCSIERTFDEPDHREDDMSAITWTDCRPRPQARPTAVSSDRDLAGGRADRPGVRLTRRGRLVVVAFAVLAVAAAALGLTGPATATGDPGTVAVAERVTVRPGETLWEIAERVRPGADPRETIARIRDMNGLTSSVAQAGQVLVVPGGGQPRS